MKPTPKESKKIHENYKKVVGHLIEEKYAVNEEAADKIISGADHFFNEHHEEMINAVKEYLDEYLK